MNFSPKDFAGLGVAAILVAANAFFVAFEFALVKVRATQLEGLVAEERTGAAQALDMRRHLDRWLSASQVGITLASLALGWVGEPAFNRLIEPIMVRLIPEIPNVDVEVAAKTISIVITFSLITFLHIVLGEQVPKTFAIAQAQRTVIALAWPMRLFYWLMFPVIWFLNLGTNTALKALGLHQASEESGEALGEDELRLVFSSSAEAGAIEASRAELLERALSMMEKTARQVMVPRPQMKCLDLEMSLDENLALAYEAGHTVLPVIRGTLDRVEGLVNVKDLYRLAAEGELTTVSQAQVPVIFVPETITLEQLLSQFRRKKKQIAVVVDEHGGTSGLVTLADVVAELVGHVAELGRKVEEAKQLPGGKLEIPGTAQLDDLSHTLELEFDVDQTVVTTIAGYLMAKLGRVPVAGDMWVREPFRFLVIKTDGPRVLTVRIEPRVAAAPAGAAPRQPPPAIKA